jgi:transposase
MYQWFLGIDWGTEEHQFCLIDATGRVRDQRKVAHTAQAIHAAIEAIRDLTGGPVDAIAVGVETPRGVLVETLLERGFAVFALNPKQLDRFRDRFSAGGAKDDRRDARAIGDGLRTDLRAFRRVRPTEASLLPLRELARLLDDLQTQRARLVNQLREQLARVDAAWLTVSPAANDPWLWTILRNAPHPDRWAQLSRRRITAVLRAHRVRRVTPETICATLRSQRLSVAAGVTDAVAVRIRALMPQLLLVHEQHATTERQLDQMLQALTETPEGEPTEHRDAKILQSLPGVGRVVAATMLAEAHGPLADRDYATLRAYTGAAPVTKRSGKRLYRVQMRYACHARLRKAMYHWARTSIQVDARARSYYDQLRQRGQKHARALRSVSDRWLRILIAMLKTGTVYDPTRFRAAAAAA